jgi:transcriptional regulator with XRE-family HTH domain
MTELVGITSNCRAYNPGVDDFGTRLRTVREHRGLSQADVARKGIDGESDPPTPESFSNHLSRVERGQETNPSLEFMERAAKGLGLTLSQFFAQIEGSTTGTKGGQTHPSATPMVETRDPTSVPAATASLDDGSLGIVTALAEVLADRFDAAVDRLIEARQQAPARGHTRAVRDGRDRKVR